MVEFAKLPDDLAQQVANYKREHPKTNADRIRSMSDEELARFFTTHEAFDSFECPIPKACGYYDNCSECFLEWLRKDADLKTIRKTEENADTFQQN